ncbi:caspase family protein [Floridanema aerugineum]|uniref:Caspase family protein n=1 Tax=Floridaenema aerugineum BLCC-F46 TaxID=3153654 RepID=A0ABV4XHX5_9CYAN
MKRRHFLQFGGSLLASLGISQVEFFQQANRYGKVLAQSTPRKLALLVGINNYTGDIRPLRGCLMDVEMQRELLIHRFGFKPQDILVITDSLATRQGIITAFENHLIKQAKPGDVAVFHYSGHGSRVVDPAPINGKNLNGTMVPIDTVTPDKNVVKDIMGKTLFLLMSAVQTENLTVVLDSCFSGGADRGNLVVRSARFERETNNIQVASEELEYQQQWLTRLKISPDKFQELRGKGIAKGVSLTSARDNQLATDARFDGFNAGAFTYLLTRYLWQQNRNQAISTTFVNLALRTQDIAQNSGMVQVPEYEVKPGSNYANKLVYFSEQTTRSAEGVIRKVSGDQVEFWLGGIASQSLEGFQQGAIFNLIDKQGKEIGQIEQTSRVGLVGYGKVIKAKPNVVKPGVLLRERVRGIPTDLTLKVGLDESLGADRSQAEKEIKAISRMEVVGVNQTDVVHYILGRVRENNSREFQQLSIPNPPPVGAIGLFTSGRKPVDNTFGIPEESTPKAIQERLKSKFKSLLAGRILQTLVTGDSSTLKVTTTIQSVNSRSAANVVSSRGNQEDKKAPINSVQGTKFKPNTEIKINIQNNENQNLFIGVVLIDSSGELLVLFPRDWDKPEDAALVAGGKTITIPRTEDNFKILLKGPSGTLEVLVLASVSPVRNALKGLQNIARSRNTAKGSPLGISEDEPDKVMGDLLIDFDEMSRAGVQLVSTIRGVDTTKIAVLSSLVEVVE